MGKLKEFDINSDSVSEFSDTVKELHNVDVNLCYQCRKCTSGCPLTYIMDYSPAQIIHAVSLGLKDLALSSNTYWVCVACGTCTTRCPQEVDILKVMDSLANIALREEVKPKAPDVANFYKVGISNIHTFGKLYEVGLGGLLKLKNGHLFQDLVIYMKMLFKGKLELLPSFQNRAAMKRIFDRVRKQEKR